MATERYRPENSSGDDPVGWLGIVGLKWLAVGFAAGIGGVFLGDLGVYEGYAVAAAAAPVYGLGALAVLAEAAKGYQKGRSSDDD